MSRISGFVVVALLGPVVGPSTAQEPPSFPSQEQVVLLDLVARDKKGRLVGDLAPGEVKVFEDGAACEIVSFRRVRSALAGSRSSDEPPRPEAPLPGEGAPSATPSRPNLVILVFDSLPLVSARLARAGALDLISRDFPADTWFAVFKIDRSMRVLQSFTSDPRSLASAIDFATSGDDARRLGEAGIPSLAPPTVPPGSVSPSPVPGPPPGTAPSAAVAGVAASVVSKLAELASRSQTLDSLRGLLVLSQSLEPVRGRKTIIHFGEAYQASNAASRYYDETISAANRANVTVHTIDARGLDVRRPGGRSLFDEVLAGTSAASSSLGLDPSVDRTHTRDTGRPDTGGGPWLDSDPFQVDEMSGSLLERVAHDTGGLAIEHSNELGPGLSRVIDELGDYYEVAYHPANPEPDGRFRRISVAVSRPGVKVRTRAGYFATARSSPGVEARELPLIAALGASPPPRDFEHESGVLHFAVQGHERETLFMARVPLSEIRLTADETASVFRGRVSILGMVRDAAGRGVARLSDDWPIEEPLERLDALRGTAALFRRAFALPPGKYTLETAVRDGQTGALSVESSAFEIPETLPGRLAVGSLTVVRRASAAEDARPDPMRVAGVSIQPALGIPKVPSSTPEIPLFLAIFPALAGASDATELRLEVLRDGQPMADLRPPLPAPEPDGEIAWIGGLPAGALSPARYEVVATVIQGDESAEARAAFEITAIGRGMVAVAAPPVPEDLVPILERAARYVLDYERAFDDIAAEESYTQWSHSASDRGTTSDREIGLSCSTIMCRRMTRADVVFVRLAGSVPWGTFRDVYEVDGQKLHDHQGRLEQLFSTSSSAGASQRSRAILDESARYNIGPAIRNINFPTLSLAFLHPKNQARFAWTRGGTRRFGNVETVEVDFEEVASPTIVDRGGHGDLPADGRFWIDSGRGTVVRSETRFRFEGRARATVSTQYRAEPRLAMWVPSEMRERYDDVPGSSAPLFGAPSEGIARYSNFRRFTVTVEDEEVALPPD